MLFCLACITTSAYARKKNYTYEELASDAQINQRTIDSFLKKQKKGAETYYNMPEERKVGRKYYRSYIPRSCRYKESYAGIIDKKALYKSFEIIKPFFISSEREAHDRRITGLIRKRHSDFHRYDKERKKLVEKLANFLHSKKSALRIANQIKTIDELKRIYDDAQYYLPDGLLAKHKQFQQQFQRVIDKAAVNVQQITDTSPETFFKLNKLEQELRSTSWKDDCSRWTPHINMMGRELESELSASMRASKADYRALDKALYDKMYAILSQPNSATAKKLLDFDRSSQSVIAALTPHIYFHSGRQVEKALKDAGIIGKIEAIIAEAKQLKEKLEKIEQEMIAVHKKLIKNQKENGAVMRVQMALNKPDGWGISAKDKKSLLKNQTVNKHVIVQITANCKVNTNARDSIQFQFTVAENSQGKPAQRETTWLRQSQNSPMLPITTNANGKALGNYTAYLAKKGRQLYGNTFQFTFEYPARFSQLSNRERTGKRPTSEFKNKKDYRISTSFVYGSAILEWTSSNLMPALEILQDLCVEYIPGDEKAKRKEG